MSGLQDDHPSRPSPWFLRRADQLTVAVLSLAGLMAMIGWWLAGGGLRGELIEIDRAPPLEVRFQVDVNRADWPELAQLPGIGETLARRIVASREAEGPFPTHEALCRVRGIGPKTLDRIRPFLRPIWPGARRGEPERRGREGRLP